MRWQKIEIQAQKTCDEIIPFSFKRFEYDFFDEKIVFENLKSAYGVYIDQLKKNEQVTTAATYQTSINSLETFHPDLSFEDITKDFLQKFESWMLDNGKSISTVGIYLRPLRGIMNLAKENGTINQQGYPFGKRKYTIPTSRNIKKSLSIEQIRQIFNYPVTPGYSIDKAKDFWIFSYLCNGINMTDIAHLQWRNVEAATICFEREKTKRSQRSNPIKIIALRNDHINRIIEKWADKTTRNNPKAYVFGILEEGDKAQAVRRKVQQLIQNTNKWMKDLGKDLGLNINLTTYVARHSFATILVRGGAPITFASQCLGHTSIATTQKYFAGFDLTAQAEYIKVLTDFQAVETK